MWTCEAFSQGDKWIPNHNFAEIRLPDMSTTCNSPRELMTCSRRHCIFPLSPRIVFFAL